jgi:hypothetical protein
MMPRDVTEVRNRMVAIGNDILNLNVLTVGLVMRVNKDQTTERLRNVDLFIY